MEKKLIMKYPSSNLCERWRDGIPLGNGEIGALVYGGAFRERAMLSHSRLWYDKSKETKLPDLSNNLKKVRDLIKEERYIEADCVYVDAIDKTDYQASVAKPLPLCDVIIENEDMEKVRGYSRVLDMEQGEAEISYINGENKITRRWFVSRENDLVFCKISAEIETTFKVSVDIHDTETLGDRKKPNAKAEYKDELISFKGINDDGKSYGSVLKCLGCDGSIKSEDTYLYLKGREFTLAIGVYVGEENHKAEEEVLEKLNSLDKDYDAYFKISSKLHNELFSKTKFELTEEKEHRSNEELLLDAHHSGEASAELLEKLWAFGRYIFICGTREGGLPFHLYGNWTGSYKPMWAINMFNENVQMIYWHTLGGNLTELALPLFDYMDSMMEDYRENARKTFGLPGIQISCYNTPDCGLHTMLWTHIITWIGGAGWMAQHYFDYYLYTGDEEFLRNRAIPFMTEAAEFYEAYLTEGEGGKYVVSPSISPENRPSNYVSIFKKSRCMQLTSVNATMDVAIIKELFTNLIQASRITGLYKDKVEDWKNLISKLPEYLCNPDGSVKEWAAENIEDNNHHRHQSHLYPVFPGTEVTKSNNPELFESFYKALEKRLEIGLKEQTGWSLAHMANIYSRFADDEKLIECLDILCQTCIMNNFFSLHNDWRNMGPCAASAPSDIPPVQLDANLGMVSALQDMLIYSAGDEVHLLPGLNKRIKYGEAGPLLIKGACEAKVKWDFDKNFFEVELIAKTQDVSFRLICPDGFNISGDKNISIKKGEAYKVVLLKK